MGYRASRQASTKHSPFFVLFQQQMRLPIDSEMQPPGEEEQAVTLVEASEEEMQQRIEHLLAARSKAFKDVASNIDSAQKVQKETYDRKHEAQVISEGTEVLLENTYQKQRKGGKMDPLWLGPYLIHRHLGKGLYELSNREGKIVKKKANIARLKLFRRRKASESTDGKPGEKPQEEVCL